MFINPILLHKLIVFPVWTREEDTMVLTQFEHTNHYISAYVHRMFYYILQEDLSIVWNLNTSVVSERGVVPMPRIGRADSRPSELAFLCQLKKYLLRVTRTTTLRVYIKRSATDTTGCLFKPFPHVTMDSLVLHQRNQFWWGHGMQDNTKGIHIWHINCFEAWVISESTCDFTKSTVRI